MSMFLKFVLAHDRYVSIYLPCLGLCTDHRLAGLFFTLFWWGLSHEILPLLTWMFRFISLCRLMELFSEEQASFIRRAPLLFSWAKTVTIWSQTDDSFPAYTSKVGTVYRCVNFNPVVHEFVSPNLSCLSNAVCLAAQPIDFKHHFRFLRYIPERSWCKIRLCRIYAIMMSHRATKHDVALESPFM